MRGYPSGSGWRNGLFSLSFLGITLSPCILWLGWIFGFVWAYYGKRNRGIWLVALLVGRLVLPLGLEKEDSRGGGFRVGPTYY